MRAPVADADLAVFANHVFESDAAPRRRMKQGLALVRGRPLRAADEVFPPRFGRISAATSLHEPVDKGPLLIRGNRFHSCLPGPAISTVPVRTPGPDCFPPTET